MILSIITITKNDPAGLQETLTSTKCLLLNNKVEQIVIDGSDSSTQISGHETMAKQFPKITHLPAAKDGISNSFNQGLALAKGDWVWFLNGGDTYNENTSPWLLTAILSNSTANAVIFEIIGKQSDKIRHHPPLWLRWPLIGNWVPHPATIINKQILTKLGGFSQKYSIAMDYDFWWRLLTQQGSIDTVSIPLTIYDETGVSSKNITKVSRENLKCLVTHLPSLLKTYLRAFRYNLLILCFLIKNTVIKK